MRGPGSGVAVLDRAMAGKQPPRGAGRTPKHRLGEKSTGYVHDLESSDCLQF